MRKLQFRAGKGFAVVIKAVKEIQSGKLLYGFGCNDCVALNIKFEIVAASPKFLRNLSKEIFTENEISMMREKLTKVSGRHTFTFEKDFSAQPFICEKDDIWFEKDGLTYEYELVKENLIYNRTLPTIKAAFNEREDVFNNLKYPCILGWKLGICSYYSDISYFIECLLKHKNVISFRGDEEGAALDALNTQKAENNKRIRNAEWQKSYSVIMEQVKLMPVEQQTEYLKMLESLNSAAMARISM